MKEAAPAAARAAAERLGVKRSYESELPPTLPREHHVASVAPGLPEQWRAYTRAPELFDELLAAGLHAVLATTTTPVISAVASRRDVVIELLDRLVVVYPAAHDVRSPDAFADLTTTALAIVDGVLAASRPVTPRGIDVRHS